MQGKLQRFWLYLIAASSFLFFSDSEAGISAVDVIIAVFYNGVLFIWLFWQLAVKRNKLVDNYADLSIFLFFIFVLLNLIISLLNDVNFLDWLREFTLLSMILYYFPIREYFTEKKHIITLLILFLLSTLCIVFMQYYGYYKITYKGLEYAWQLIHSIRLNMALFAILISYGTIFLLYQKKLLNKLLLISIVILSSGALISTFARTFWLVAIILLFIVFLYIPISQKLRMTRYSFILIVLLFAMITLIFKGNAEIVFSAITQRFTSSTKGTKDISVRARLDEYKVIYKKIEQYPLGGSGMGKEFSFHEPILKYEKRTDFIHNGYLFFSYRLGIPVLCIFLFSFIYFIIKAENYSRLLKDNFYKLLALGSLCSLILMLVSDFSTTQFLQRDGVFILAVSYAFIGIISRKEKEI